MKKIYNTPAMLCVGLRTTSMMATSEYSVNKDSVSDGSDGDFIDVKVISDKSVWDTDW